LSRQLAVKIAKEAWWDAKAGNPGPHNFNKFDWAKLIEVLLDHADFQRLPQGTKNILKRVAAVTGHRNESNHPPQSRSARIKRDCELRTRFESAGDLLRDMARVTR
jgi:hypothetical protein